MHIMILADRIPPHHIGGAGKVAWDYARGYAQAGHRVSVITATPEASYTLTREGIAIYALHSRYPVRWRAWWSLYNPQVMRKLGPLLDALHPDAIHAHNIHADLSYAALCAAHRRDIPVAWTAHDVMSFAYTKLIHHIDATTCQVKPAQLRLPVLYNLRQMRARYNPLRNLIIQRVLRRCVQHRIAVSETLQAALQANNVGTFTVLHNGLVPGDFAPPTQAQQSQLRQALNLVGHPVVLFSGRLSALKGGPQLLAALDIVVTHMPEARLLILSATPVDGRWLQGLPHITPAHICESGWLSGDDLLAAYALADVVVVPSVYLDPFPTVALEAMALGQPVIGSCFSGAQEAIINGQTGYILNPHDTHELARKLLGLLQDARLRQQMGEASRARFLAHFTHSQRIEKMLQILHR
ncbi:MAG: glycosyltransferase family 4 protein [Anaerolineales bacterium]